ncbi:hypothetical protein KR054_000912 [Drosophila jambulina]|nr:hypothetical protein KR054_000912 [Drosophila jambulina]
MAELQEHNHRQLLDLLPADQRQVFETFIQWLYGKATGPVHAHQTALQTILRTSPYPALQLLQLLHVHSKLHIGQIIAAVLQQLLAEGDVSSSSSLCLLANFPGSILEAATLRQKLITRLASDSASKEHILLALLARSEGNLLEDVLHEKQQTMRTKCSEAAPTRELVLWLALGQQEHFVATMCQQLKDFECIQDRTLRNTLLILRLANEFALGTQTLAELGCLDKCLKEFDASAAPEELQEVHKFFFADFQRLATLLNFLQPREASKTLKVEALLRAPGVLTLIHDYGIQCEHQELLSLLEDTHKWQLQTPALRCLYQQETEILSYYTALCHVYNMILDQGEQSTKAKLVQLSGQMRQLHQLGTLCSLLEDIFLLVFLRWEQLEQSPQRRREEQDDDDEEDDDEQYVDDDVTKPQRPAATAAASHSQRTRYGFICRSPSLQALFTFLRAFVTKKLHSQDYKCAAEHHQRFQRLVDAINETLCKLGVLNKIDQSLAASAPSLSCLLDPEQLLQLVQLHSTAKEKASSDDESRERSNHASSLCRRKARKQRRAVSFSGAAVSKTPTDGGLTMEQYRARAQLLSGHGRKNSCVTSPGERSIIPKMLSTPEQLAIMALALKNFNDVKQIIETFHLQQSQLSRELQFMEQQQLVKQKLATIYANYQALEARHPNSDETTVEQIKGVAAKGFELSKIISVVDNFAQAQRLQQSPELKALIQRHQSGFLQQFEERNLNALIICDLIVNLGFNREITSNLLLVIRRQQQLKVTTDEAISSSNSTEIGAMNFLQNLCECMRLLERSGQQPALNDLLSRQSYPLRPSVLAMQLQREAAFQTIYGREAAQYSHGQELRANAGQFQQLRSRWNYYGRFCSYVQQLARLLQLRDPNLEYHNSQLLRNDPYEVIGELIYECGITPLEIESSVAALHLNLVHVIALNICPQLGEETMTATTQRLPRVVAPQKKESIHNYTAQHNQLLAQILQAVQLGSLPDGEVGLDFSCLGQLMQLPEVECLASMYEGNRVLAALNAYKLDSITLEKVVTDRELLLQILLLGMGNQSESQEQLKSRIDRLIAELIKQDPRHIQLVVHMSDLGLRASLLKEHFTRIASSQLAKELIERTVQHHRAAKEIPPQLRSQLESTLSDITIYAKVSALLQFESWPQAYDFGRQTPNVIFEQLLQRRRFGLCLEWSRVVYLAGSAGQQRVCLLTLLDALLELRDNEELDENLLGIVEMFPPSSLVNFLDTHKDKFRSLPLLQWVIDYLEGHARDPRLYRNYQLSLELLRQMASPERLQFWKLLRHPLLIVEQLVMNARFELLGKLLEAARSKLQKEKPLGPCPYCFEKRGHVYDVQSTSSPGAGGGTAAKVRFQLGQTTSEAFILLNFNSYQQDHFVGQECLDLLLRIYASKALDYHVANLRPDCEPSSLGTDVQNSLDSLCGAFVMPKQAPSRQQWTRDEEASHCMCCRRAAFTMLMRRHHCRRCGRVVCYACSTHRMRIPELYDELEVRICNDCANSSSASKDQGDGASSERSTVSGSASSSSSGEVCKWRLSGIITHDKLLREEFSYEHAPSVALSLSILRHHVEQKSCVELLLFHCRKLEKLIVPNPEVDYGLVAKMINCLAFAAKVRGAPGEFENIREHSEIVMAVVQQGCESLIPAGPLDNHNLRKLADALVEAEHWTLALEVHLKFGFATTGVMAAHGLACLRAGCYEAAREKFAHCMARLSSEQINSSIYKAIFGASTATESCPVLPKKRPQRGPALLQEILLLIAAMPQTQPQPETLHRASLIRSSNSSLASLFSRRREPYVQQRPLQEPALNVMNALAGLRNIAKGNYGGQIPASEEGRRQERGFEESLHYVLTYGSHSDILTFLMRRDELRAALRYWQLQQLDADLFIQHIFQPHLQCGTLPLLVDELQQMEDAQLSSWRLPLLQTCRHLEQQQQLNSLYQLQLLLKDPIRASMTCVKFYALNCENFQKMQANAQHLVSAHMHLQGELDLAEWEHLQRQQQQQQQGRRGSGASTASVRGACFAMQMDARALNGHINTIRRQLEVVKFLAKCEREQPPDEPLKTMQTLKQIRLESNRGTLPTLFEGAADRIQLSILVLLCGKNIDEGFGLAYGIMQDYKLASIKVFGATAKYLARNQRLAEVERLLDCIGSNSGGGISAESDEILSIAINSAVHSNAPETKQTLDRLINRISSVELRISSYIYIGQLKSAYLLANKHERLMDIRRILRQAELTGQVHIKRLCEMKLQLSAPPTPL